MISNTAKINLSTYKRVSEFVEIVKQFKDPICLTSDKQKYTRVIDAKSILGILSIDILHNINVTIETTNENIITDFMSKIEKFIVEK